MLYNLKIIYVYVVRYAFTPLLDAPEDGDDEEEEYFVSDAYGKNELVFCDYFKKYLIKISYFIG